MRYRGLLCVLLLTLSYPLPAAEVVISHPDVTTTHLSRNMLRALFSVRATRWPDGQPVQVFVLPDQHPQHRAFVKTRLDMFPYQLRMIWDRSVFSGAGYPPTPVSTAQEMLRQVQRTPGAIGYLDPASLPALQGVNIIATD